jgi:hypothetical protein
VGFYGIQFADINLLHSVDVYTSITKMSMLLVMGICVILPKY